MKGLISTIFFLPLMALCQVYPGAKGNGSNWSWPPDSGVRIVENLSDSGPGSLRDAIESPTALDAFHVVFNGLSGRIVLQDDLEIPEGVKIWIEGATSEHGIWLSMANDREKGLVFSSAPFDGLIIRNMILALGPGQLSAETTPNGGTKTTPGSGDGSGNVNGDNVTFLSGKNVMIDKCAMFWSTDESVNLFSNQNITIQNSIIAESLMYSTHAYTTDSSSTAYYAPHSMGMLIGRKATNISLFNNIWAHNNQRSPLVGNTGGIQNMELVNNYNYNWGDYAMGWNEDSGQVNLNIMNNVYDNGPDSRSERRPVLINPDNGDMSIYAEGLYSDLFASDYGVMTDRGLGLSTDYDVDLRQSVRRATPHDFPMSNYPLLSRTQIKDSVMANAGTIFNTSTEQRIKQTIENGNGSLINDPSDVGGYPLIPQGNIIADIDRDGIPDDREAEFGDDTYAYILSLHGTVPAPVLPPIFIGGSALKRAAGIIISN